MTQVKVPRERVYSEYWSNREYLYVHDGNLVNKSVPSVVRRKLRRIVKALREIQNPASIDTVTLKDLTDALAHLFDIMNYDEQAEVLRDMVGELETMIELALENKDEEVS